MLVEDKNKPLVSVIVPCYNQAKYLAEALDSVLAQSYANWECVIIDDGSTDNSKEIAERYCAKDKRFKYIHQPNKGVSSARNNAIKASSGLYILPLDGDDKIAPHYLEQAINVFQKSPDVKLVYGKARLFGKGNGDWNIPPYSFKEMMIENLIYCSAVYRREDFNKTNGYSEEMKAGFEDWDFWLTFLDEEDKVFCLPEVQFYYRVNASSRNPVTDEAVQRELRKKIFEHHKEKYLKYFSLSDIMSDSIFSQKKLEGVYNSRSYRIGRLLSSPVRFLRRLF
jgi:glycosyltransferase involved in cell wall biosynthesis